MIRRDCKYCQKSFGAVDLKPHVLACRRYRFFGASCYDNCPGYSRAEEQLSLFDYIDKKKSPVRSPG